MPYFNKEYEKKIKIVNSFLKVFFTVKKPTDKVRLSDESKVLIMDLTLIGDIVMLIPLLRIIKNNHPNINLDLACGPWGPVLLEKQRLIDKFYNISMYDVDKKNVGKISKFIRSARKKKYDLIIETKGDLRYIFLSRFLRKDRTLSYDFTGAGYMLTDIVDSSGCTHLVDEKIHFSDYLELNYSENDIFPILKKSDCYELKREKYREDNSIKGKMIGIHPGASRRLKQWKHYDAVIEKIHNSIEHDTLVFFEGPGEEDAVKPLVDMARQYNLNYIVSKTGLGEYIKALSYCDLVICNDSGAGHIAAAYGIPVVVVMGPYEDHYCAPKGKYVTIVSENVECKPCWLKECKHSEVKCLEKIDYAKVSNQIVRYLNKLEREELYIRSFIR